MAVVVESEEEGQMTELKTPFPYFGGKAIIADEVWARFGDVQNYVEPFFGSGAVLLRRPSWHKGGVETVNDLDGMVSNFWRSVAADPEQTAYYADWPVNENDLTARHLWLVGQKESLQTKVEGDPDYYDPKVAGWWAWGMSCWIGSGFCSGNGPWLAKDGLLVHRDGDEAGVSRPLPRLTGSQGVNRKLPRLTGSQGVNRQLPHLAGTGKGVNRQLPQLRNAGEGVNRKRPHLCGIYAWFDALSARLRRVRVCCGDWSRVTGPAVTFGLGLSGVFLDPPYSMAEREPGCYTHDAEEIAADVAAWARENGDNPNLRLALCGYESEHEMPPSWSVYHWKAAGGYGSQGNGRGRENAKRETVWFSPHCLKHEQSRMELP